MKLFWVLKSSSWTPEYENIKNTETTEIQTQCRCPPQSFLKKDPTRHSKNQPCFTQDFRMILPVSLCVPSLAVRFSGWFLIRFHFPCVRKRISSSDSSNFQLFRNFNLVCKAYYWSLVRYHYCNKASTRLDLITSCRKSLQPLSNQLHVLLALLWIVRKWHRTMMDLRYTPDSFMTFVMTTVDIVVLLWFWERWDHHFISAHHRRRW